MHVVITDTLSVCNIPFSHIYVLWPASLPQKNLTSLHPAGAGMEIKQAAWPWLTEAGSPGDRSHLAEVLFAFSDVQ